VCNERSEQPGTSVVVHWRTGVVHAALVNDRFPPILAVYATKPDVRFGAAVPLDRTAGMVAKLLCHSSSEGLLWVIFDVSPAYQTGPMYLKNRTYWPQSDTSESRQNQTSRALPDETCVRLQWMTCIRR
jgi:hypothetical protein